VAGLADVQQRGVAVEELNLPPALRDLKVLRARQDERKGVAAAVLHQLVITECKAGAERGAHPVQDWHDRGVKRYIRRRREIDAVHAPGEAIAPLADRIASCGHVVGLR